MFCYTTSRLLEAFAYCPLPLICTISYQLFAHKNMARGLLSTHGHALHFCHHKCSSNSRVGCESLFICHFHPDTCPLVHLHGQTLDLSTTWSCSTNPPLCNPIIYSSMSICTFTSLWVILSTATSNSAISQAHLILQIYELCLDSLNSLPSLDQQCSFLCSITVSHYFPVSHQTHKIPSLKKAASYLLYFLLSYPLSLSVQLKTNA